MKEVTEEEKAMYVYALHIVIYVNDKSTFAIRQLWKDVKEKDKESKKIYGALYKRVSKYVDNLYEREGDKDTYFYYDFNEYMDRYFLKDIEGLRRSAEWIFRCNGYEDYKYLSKVESAFSLICLSISIANSYICGLKKNGARTFILPEFKLDEIHRIMGNFYDWTMFTQHKEKVLDLSRYKSVEKYFNNIKEKIVDRKIFEEAYTHALEEERKRNNKQ